jgi:hypothetical protein
MADEDDEDALFDRLAKSLGAIRQDAELARSAGVQATSESVARTEAELHRLATGTDALRNQVDQQRAVTMRLEAAVDKSDADVQDLRRTVEGLLHREWAQAEASAMPSARKPRRRVGVLIGMALVVLILGGGAVAWNGSGREPTFRTLAHRVVAQLSEFTGIDLGALVEPAQTARIAAQATPTPAPISQPAPAAASAAVGVISAKTPSVVPPAPAEPPAAAPPPAQTAAVAPPPSAETPVAAAPPPAQTAGAIPPSPVTLAPAAVLPPDQSETPAAAAAAPSSQPGQASHQILLRATGTTWVKVSQKGGGVLLRRTMKAGETWPVPDDPDLILDTGNAVGLELMVDGVPTKLPVTKGGVIHNLPLDADLRSAGAVRVVR